MSKKTRINRAAVTPSHAAVKSRLRKKLILLATAGIVTCGLLGGVMMQVSAKEAKSKSDNAKLDEATELFRKVTTNAVHAMTPETIRGNPHKAKGLEYLKQKDLNKVIETCSEIYTASPGTRQAVKARLLAAYAYSRMRGEDSQDVVREQIATAFKENGKAAEEILATEHKSLYIDMQLAQFKEGDRTKRMELAFRSLETMKKSELVFNEYRKTSNLLEQQSALGKVGINSDKVQNVIDKISKDVK
jgi:hypothetical protein